MYFAHQKLQVYAVALEVARWVVRADASRGLKDQLVRAAQSVVLNIAEGAAQPPGDARRNHFRIAHGSAAEVAAALALIGAPAEVVDRVQRVGAMLGALTRR